MTESLKILVVEDHYPDAHYLVELLRDLSGWGVEARICSQPREAPTLCVAEAFDIVFVDYRMGPVDGVDLIRDLAAGPAAGAAFVLLTGQGDERVAAEAMRAGAMDYLIKGDLTSESLDRSLRYLVGRLKAEQARRESENSLRNAHASLEAEIARRTEELRREVQERRRAETAANEAREHAELANRAKSELLANMSHELRTPLNAIIGFSCAMLDELLGPLGNAGYRDYAKDIRDSGTHLLDLINDILDVAAIEAGKLKLQQGPMDLAALTFMALRMVKPRAETGKIALENLVPQDLPYLFGDERRIKQVLVNLLSNAVKFTPEGGLVTVSAGLETDGRITLRVTDTGIGMDADGIAKAKAKFSQVESGFNRRNEGTGLGLPLTIGLVELHEGALDIESAKGSGTTITIRFPPGRQVSRT